MLHGRRRVAEEETIDVLPAEAPTDHGDGPAGRPGGPPAIEPPASERGSGRQQPAHDEVVESL
jgi:hypothetical protein